MTKTIQILSPESIERLRQAAVAVEGFHATGEAVGGRGPAGGLFVTVPPRGQNLLAFEAVVVKPAEAENLDDHGDSRYYVERAVCLNDDTEDADSLLSFGRYGNDGDDLQAFSRLQRRLTVTNLAENGSHFLTEGTVVRVYVVQDRLNPRISRYYIVQPPVVAAFPVQVKKDGGVAGDDATDCSFTYEIYQIGNQTDPLSSAVTPQRSRYPKTTYLQPTDFSYGLALYDGSYKLLDVYEEIPDTAVCS